MAGMLPHMLARELDPEEAMKMAPSGPLIDLLARFLAQTQAQPYGKQHRSSQAKPEPQPSPTPAMMNQMRKMHGPIEAKTARKIANERDRVMKELERY